MRGYDATLKLLLQSPSSSVLRHIFRGATIQRWLNVEMPQVRAQHADLLGATSKGSLIHTELQSTNDIDMPLRMAEYALAIYRRFRTLPDQLVLYVGEPEMRMEDKLIGAGLNFRYRLLDIRALDTDELLTSPQIEDNLTAILTRLKDKRVAVRTILQRIAELEPSVRKAALAQFLILSGLRRLAPTIDEVRAVPILDDLLTHEIIGPAILKGRAEGIREGEREGMLRGQRQGSEKILRNQLGRRFGPLPAWADRRLSSLSDAEIEDLGNRLLTAEKLEDLFPNQD